MILVINTCKEKLHYYEFVKPIEDILNENNEKFFTLHYLDVKSRDLSICDRVIVCGTSLADNQFLKEIKKFEWLKDFNKPTFGICAGMQIIGLVFGGKIKKKTEIGYYFEDFQQDYFGLKGKQEVYHLHNNYISGWKGFDFLCSGNGIVQAVKHKEKEIYGCLFHPEVRNKEVIKRFVEL